MTEGWATFGKGVAVTLGLAAAGVAVYLVGDHIYDNGFRDGGLERAATAQEEQGAMRESYTARIKGLTADGKLIPSNSCWIFRNGTEQGTERDLYGGEKAIKLGTVTLSGCNGIELKVLYNPDNKLRGITATDGKTLAEISKAGGTIHYKEAEKWVKGE